MSFVKVMQYETMIHVFEHSITLNNGRCSYSVRLIQNEIVKRKIVDERSISKYVPTDIVLKPGLKGLMLLIV